MDLAMELAEEVDADIVVANDPDADRCAVAVPGPHGWQMLRGDEVGALLAQHLLGRGREGVYATSIVSSSLLGKMAAAAGQPYAETLTGFKWIGRVREPRLRLRGGARLLRRPDPREGQGRRLRADAGLLPRRPREGRGSSAARPARRPGPRARTARHRPALGPDGRPRRDPGGGRPAARRPARLARRARRRAGRRPLARLARRTPDQRAPVHPGRPGPGRRTPVGHRAQDQVLPRGGRTRGRPTRTAWTPLASPPPAASTPSAPT